jgi:hypothetical protein
MKDKDKDEIEHGILSQITDISKVLRREMSSFFRNSEGSSDPAILSTGVSQIEILSNHSLTLLNSMLEELKQNPGGSLNIPAGRNLYRLLQVDPRAETNIIRYSYRYLAAKYHPDNPITGSHEMFRTLTDAWKLLSNDERRAEYDATLRMD